MSNKKKIKTFDYVVPKTNVLNKAMWEDSYVFVPKYEVVVEESLGHLNVKFEFEDHEVEKKLLIYNDFCKFMDEFEDILQSYMGYTVNSELLVKIKVEFHYKLRQVLERLVKAGQLIYGYDGKWRAK